jgi:putative tryptophan/tyrosine transport system substrate-binding protein
MARTAETDCATRDTDSGPSRSGLRRRDRPICCDPESGYIRGRVERIDPRDAGELKRAIPTFAREPNGGLIVTGSASAAVHNEQINSLAMQHRLPAICPFRYWVLSGGLASYGPNTVNIFGRAATYVDRILKGEKPSDLPVQAPTKYELVINLQTAKALGLEIQPSLLATADEVIE